MGLADKQGPPQSGSGPPGGGYMQQAAPPGYGNGFARSEPYGKGAPPMALAMYGHPKGSGKGSSLKDEFLLPNMPQRIAQAEPNSKLYVKNVPLYADDLYLYRVFAPFGTVLNVKCTNKQALWAVGFVQYQYAVEAQSAIAGVNGQPLADGTVLEVSVKTQKVGL